MNRETYWKGKTAVDQGHVKLVEVDSGYLSFKVKDLKRPNLFHDVWRDGSGVWHCNAVTTKKVLMGVDKWGLRQYRDEKVHCPTFNMTTTCWHTLACKIKLKQFEDKREQMIEEGTWNPEIRMDDSKKGIKQMLEKKDQSLQKKKLASQELV